METLQTFASKCRVASPHDSVYHSECVYTFYNPYSSSDGILVNLRTHVGTIQELAFTGVETSGTNSTSPQDIFLRIVKERIVVKDTTASEAQGGEGGNTNATTTESNPTKLGLGVDGGFQDSSLVNYDTISTYSIVLLEPTDTANVKVIVEVPFNDETKSTLPLQIVSSAESIINHAGTAIQQDIQAFELQEEVPISKYAATLTVLDNGVTISPNPQDWKCQKAGDVENVWLNLSDGYMGGGRANWDGSGGSNGALDHFNETGQQYPLVVKLGTITADIDTADCYSYAPDEDGPVKIPNLKELLEKRGIKVSGLQKTQKSTAELEVELNANYAFDAITESGAALTPVSGPGYQGLQNVGNSCYIHSVVQLLLSGTVPELATRYGSSIRSDVKTLHALQQHVAPTDAPLDILCQMAKVGCALTSGAYACPVSTEKQEVEGESTAKNDISDHPKYRLPLRMFKHAVGKDHADFCTGQQQDAAQFLQYLLEKLDRAEMGGASRITSEGINSLAPASHLFKYKSVSRIICNQDGRVKYKDNEPETMLSLRVPMSEAIQKEPDEKRPKTGEKGEEEKKEDDVPTVSFQACLDAWSASHPIDGLRWAHLNNAVSGASETLRFSNFPRYLIIQIQRYEMGADWVPRKLEVNLDISDEIDLSSLASLGPQDGENIVQDEDEDVHMAEPTSSNTAPTINEGALAQLMDMGFSMNGCKRALTTVGGSDVEAAMNWIFEHSTDPDFNDPLPEMAVTSDAGASIAASTVDESVVMMLVQNLGCFTAEQVRAALEECNGQADRAADWLFSHMDDIDAAIASLQSAKQSASVEASSKTPSLPLEDGKPRYHLIGMVSHIGKNTGSGHYVAHLKKNDQWVIFNDEKVAVSENPPKPHAYMYLFQRDDCTRSPDPKY